VLESVPDPRKKRGPPVTPFPSYRPRAWEPLKRIDEQRYANGQPNLFDVGALTPGPTQLLGI
jgi:hypothetical protein